MSRDSWDCGEFFTAGFGPRAWAFCGSSPRGRGRSRRRQQMFESGEMKYVILRLVKEKPRHGYEVIKALEEKFGGWYSPSAGTVYPTLQLLEDQGYVRIVEEEGKKVYHITPEGEAFLEEHRDVLDDIIDRVRDVVRDGVTGFIVPPDNADALANGIRRFFGEHRGEEFEANVRVEKKRYTWEALVTAIEEMVVR